MGTITLLRADGVPLGLDFVEEGQCLRVKAVSGGHPTDFARR